MATATEKLLRPRDVEAIFAAFVRNATAVGRQARTTRSDSAETRAELDGRARNSVAPAFDLEQTVPIDVADDHQHVDPALLAEGSGAFQAFDLEDARTDESIGPNYSALGEDTSRHEALRVVPDVSSVRPPVAALREGSEDGEIPPRELERLMEDMAVLSRYGHEHDVVERLHALRQQFPRDLLLLRRIAELHLRCGREDHAVECLFQLARSLFERRNVVGMRAALEQILVLRSDDPRAHKLVALLERR